MRVFLVALYSLQFLTAVPADSVDTESAVAQALAHNPALAAARFTVIEAQGRLDQAGRLSNPELGTEFKPNLQGQQGILKVGLEQRFPLTSRLRREKAVSRRELAAAQAEIRDAERRLAAETRAAVIEIAALNARRELREEQRVAVQRWLDQATRTASLGEGSATEVDQLQLEIGELKLHQRLLAAETATALTRLRPLLGLPDDAPLTVQQTLAPPEVAHPTELILAQRGDYQASQQRTAAAVESTELARARRWQDLGVGVFGEWERMINVPPDLQKNQYVGLQLMLPLPFWNNQKGQIREANAAAAREALAMEALATRIRAETSAARQEMTAAAELEAEIAHELIPAAERLEKRLQELQLQGQGNWPLLIRAREKRLELQAAQLDARRDYHLARNRWLAATGLILVPQP